MRLIVHRTLLEDFSDILIAALTLEEPEIISFIQNATDGIESFAFYPNGKMAVATGLGPDSALASVRIERLRMLRAKTIISDP